MLVVASFSDILKYLNTFNTELQEKWKVSLIQRIFAFSLNPDVFKQNI